MTDHTNHEGAGSVAMLQCTCEQRGKWLEFRLERPEVAGNEPPRCTIHPVQTVMGDVMVSTAMRASSAIGYTGWYEETLVFRLTSDGRKLIDQCDLHFEAVRKWFGPGRIVYEAAWREIDGVDAYDLFELMRTPEAPDCE